MMKSKIKFVISALSALMVMGVIFVPKPVDALAVTVKRVVFQGSKRAEVITIINNSDEAETYRLGWKHFVMSESEGLKAISEDELPPEVRPSKDMVKFSPRRFTLPPKGSQQVRMMLRMPSGVEDGEYRSHLWIRPEENVRDFRQKEGRAGKGKTGVSMKMLAGTSMPVIVRKGNLDYTADIQGLTAARQGEFVVAKFSILREGGRSSYGDLDFVCNPGADEYLLKFIRGVSVYSETPKRSFSLKIPLNASKPQCSSLLVRYTEVDGFAGEPIALLSEAQAQIQ